MGSGMCIGDGSLEAAMPAPPSSPSALAPTPPSYPPSSPPSCLPPSPPSCPPSCPLYRANRRRARHRVRQVQVHHRSTAAKSTNSYAVESTESDVVPAAEPEPGSSARCAVRGQGRGKARHRVHHRVTHAVSPTARLLLCTERYLVRTLRDLCSLLALASLVCC